MKYKYSFLLIIFLMFLMLSCSGRKNKNEPIKSEKEKNTEIKKESYLFDDTVEPFYTVDPKLEDIEAELALLKEQVIQYESQISTPNFNTEILKLIKNPSIKHEIQLSNGTIIQGVIIYENVDQLIVETQIGQLQINKNEVVKTTDIAPPTANLEFIGDAIEEIYESHRIFRGSVKNIGSQRADFVRVIYSIHDENSNLIAIDSAFVSGTKKRFNSGIVSDASIHTNEFGDFYVKVEIPDNKEVRYLFRDVRWEYFE